MNHRFCCAALGLAFLLAFPAAAFSAERPNVVFFLIDDWGWTDAGCYGSDLYETPHIDRMAERGMRFTNGYAACTVCSPTRAACMTGMYPGRTNVTDWIPGAWHHHDEWHRKYPMQPPPDWTQKLEHRYVTIAEALADAGYKTAHVGKWHLTPRSDDPEVVEPYYPENQGFHVNVAGNQWGAPGSYFWPFKRGKREGLAQRVANFPSGGMKGDYLTDTLTDEVLQIIENWRDEPFFIYFPHYAVHTPIQGKKQLVRKYKQKIKSHEGELRHDNPTYAAMIESVDDSVGRIVAKLNELDLAEETVIVLTGDNGGLDRRGGWPTENAPLRAGKGSAYEGGVRVPFLVEWPGETPAGSVSDEPVISVDIYPTLLEIAGVEGDPQHNANVDGESLVPVLRSPDARLDRDALYWHYPHYHNGGARPYSAIRARDWRLVQWHRDKSVELYSLAEDLGETQDLAESHPEKARELRKKLAAWRERVDAQSGQPNPEYEGDTEE